MARWLLSRNLKGITQSWGMENKFKWLCVKSCSWSERVCSLMWFLSLPSLCSTCTPFTLLWIRNLRTKLYMWTSKVTAWPTMPASRAKRSSTGKDTSRWSLRNSYNWRSCLPWASTTHPNISSSFGKSKSSSKNQGFIVSPSTTLKIAWSSSISMGFNSSSQRRGTQWTQHRHCT